MIVSDGQSHTKCFERFSRVSCKIVTATPGIFRIIAIVTHLSWLGIVIPMYFYYAIVGRSSCLSVSFESSGIWDAPYKVVICSTVAAAYAVTTTTGLFLLSPVWVDINIPKWDQSTKKGIRGRRSEAVSVNHIHIFCIIFRKANIGVRRLKAYTSWIKT